MYQREIKTLFNPLIKDSDPNAEKADPNGWLERVYTSPSVAMLAHNDAIEFTSLFNFENIGDMSQASYIDEGVKTFIDGLQSLHVRIFTLAAKSLAGESVILGSIGPEKSEDRVEQIMRQIYEGVGEREVDTTYCYPALGTQPYDGITRVGWMEKYTGSFVFSDQQTFKSMCRGLGINAGSSPA